MRLPSCRGYRPQGSQGRSPTRQAVWRRLPRLRSTGQSLFLLAAALQEVLSAGQAADGIAAYGAPAASQEPVGTTVVYQTRPAFDDLLAQETAAVAQATDAVQIAVGIITQQEAAVAASSTTVEAAPGVSAPIPAQQEVAAAANSTAAEAAPGASAPIPWEQETTPVAETTVQTAVATTTQQESPPTSTTSQTPSTSRWHVQAVRNRPIMWATEELVAEEGFLAAHGKEPVLRATEDSVGAEAFTAEGGEQPATATAPAVEGAPLAEGEVEGVPVVEGSAEGGEQGAPENREDEGEEGEGEGAEGKEEEKEEGEEGEGEEGKEEEEEGEKGEAEEEEEEWEKATPVDISIAAMLCGAVAFQMMIFYVVNYDDIEIKQYAWRVISSTVSIFASVLLFSSLNHSIDVLLLEELGEVHRAAAQWGMLLVWLFLLQIIIMFLSGTVTWADCCSSAGRDQHDEILACWGTLFSHMAGFASIYAGGRLQRMNMMSRRPITVFMIAPIHIAAVLGVLVLFEQFRKLFSAQVHRRALLLWEEYAREAENDVSALSLSFLIVQAIKFNFTGTLSNMEGLEHPIIVHPMSCSVGLLGIGLAFAVAVVAVEMTPTCHSVTRSSLRLSTRRKTLREAQVPLDLIEVEDKARQPATRDCLPRVKEALLSYIERGKDILQGSCAMAFAWCLFYAAKWEMQRISPEADTNAMPWRVGLAMILSFGSFAFIFVLDKLADMEATDEDADRAIESVINGLGLLVGFGWEQSFEGAAETLSTLLPRTAFSELFIAAIVGVIVIPAWRRYILRSAIEAKNNRAAYIAQSRQQPIANTRFFSSGRDSNVSFSPLGQDVPHTDHP